MEKIKLSEFGFNILQIESTAACNMACSFCPYPLKEDKTSKIDLESIYKILDRIDYTEKDFKYVTFSQFNEPLLDRRIFDILKHCKDKNIPVHFATNGLLLNKENNVKKYGTNIKISLQILDANKHKDARGLNLELDRYVQRIIKFCLEVKKEKNLNVTIDLGCNFNDKKLNYYIKKFLGVQIGDPSAPKDLNSSMLMFSKFLDYFSDISDKIYKNSLEELKKPEKYFTYNYIKQEGYKICDNIVLKLKPFFYGRRISQFYPINDNFNCDSKILGILADGNVVPCCLAYDDTISLGKINEMDLKDILISGEKFLKNLRTNNLEKHDTCKKCFGEPTKRGVIVRNIWNTLPYNVKKTFNFFNLTKN